MAIREGERHDGDGKYVRAIRHIQAKPVANKPGILCLDAVSDTGVKSTYYLWVDSTGKVRILDRLPADQDGQGVIIISSSTGLVTTGMITDGAVTTAKIADLNVTTAKLADGAVTMAKMTPKWGAVTIDPPSIAAASTVNVDVAVAGLATTDKVIAICQGALEHGLVCIGASVPVADTLRIRLTNWTGAAIDGAALTWLFAKLP